MSTVTRSEVTIVCEPRRRNGPGIGRLLAPVALALVVTAMPAAAQDVPPPPQAQLPPQAMSDKPAYRLSFDHLTGVVEVRNSKDEILERWETRVAGAAPVVAQLPPDRPVVVSIENANPFLYTYDVEVLPIAQSDVRACSDIGGEFARRGSMIGMGALTGQAQIMPDVSRAVQGTDLVRLWEQVDQGASRGASDEAAALSEAAMEAAMASVRIPVVSYAETLETVNTLSTSLADSLRLVAELGDALPVDSILASLQENLEARQAGLSDPARLPTAIRQRTSQVAPELSTLGELERSVITGRYGGFRSDPVAQEVMDLSARVARAQRGTEQGYLPLRNDLLRIQRARQQTRQVFTVAASRDFRRITVITESREGFDDVIRTRDGRVALYTEPSVSFTCEVSIGFAFMSKPPEFEAWNGTLRDAADGDTRTTASLMLLLSSPKFPLVGALAGIGIGSDKVPDFYLGGSLRILDPVMLNAGVVWQRVHRLPGDLSLGQAIEDEALLDDLPRSFRASTFFGVSLVR